MLSRHTGDTNSQNETVVFNFRSNGCMSPLEYDRSIGPGGRFLWTPEIRGNRSSTPRLADQQQQQLQRQASEPCAPGGNTNNNVFAICIMSDLGLCMGQWWTASGNFWQSVWDRMYDLCGRNDYNVAVWGFSAWVLIIFFTTHTCFLILDFLTMPRFLVKYKIQTRKNNPLQFKVFKSALPLVLVNLFLTPLPYVILSPLLYKWRGMPFTGPLPTFPRFLLEDVIFTLIDEIGFYYAHRLFHHPFFYKRIHKIHHEFTSPFSIISIYCHPVEHICANLFPPLLGPILLGSHMGVMVAYTAFVIVTPAFTHCGYSFPFPGIDFHDFHHLKFNVNYGVLGLLDRFHGTDIMYRNASKAERKDIKSAK